MDLNLSNDRLLEDECETYYYGFNSTELNEDMEFLLQNSLKKSLKSVKENIIDIKSCNTTKKTILDTYMDNLYKTYMECIAEVLKKFKLEVQKTFSIPKNVILPGTELQNKHKGKQYSLEDIVNMEGQIAELTDKILKEQVFLDKLRQEKELINTKLQPLFENVNRAISVSTSLLSSNKEKVTKVLDLHEKSMKYYLDSIGESDEQELFLGSEESLIDKANFFE